MPVVTISGTSGANAVTINTAGIYSVNLGSGDDTLLVHAPTDITAHGGVGNDSLSVSDSTGLIYGDIGQDTILVSSGTYTIFGGTGPVDPTDGKDVITVSDTSAIVYGNGGNDTILFADSAVTVYAGSGNDFIASFGGKGGNEAPIIEGDAVGPALIYGNAGDNAVIYGNAGSDTILAAFGAYTVYGGSAGVDTADLADFIALEGAKGVAYGNAGDDAIQMIDGGYTAYGGIGDDTVVADASSAVIYGNAGQDILLGAAGSYTVYGGNGTVDPTDGKDTITLSRSAALVYGNGGSDLITAHSAQAGSEGSDTITAFYGNALTAYGGAGDDTIDLAYGSGIMLGQTGSDSLVVSLASATMDGGAGDDILSATHSSITKMTGGTGSDTFVLNSFDSATNVSKDIGYTEITDFTTADELDLQDHNGVITSVPAWNTHASFFTTGSNLVVQFHNTTAAHTTPFLVFDGLAGHGFHSFTDMQAAGYHIVATFDLPPPPP